jgi:octaheme c-type cytochrome (tetrathionate reductase family)
VQQFALYSISKMGGAMENAARMQAPRYGWAAGLLATLLVVIIPIVLFVPGSKPPADQPWAAVPVRKQHVDHRDLLKGPYESGSEVTRACLECHPQSAQQVMSTVHWTWESKPYQVPGHDEPVTIGKKNSLNNFCIGIQSNWPSCTSCHAGYGWTGADFDFSIQENVDCLVCHDQSGQYTKGKGGLPKEGVDLAAAARSVALPTRQNCGSCHFNGGGGDAVKHGDLDQALLNPTRSVDVHMGGLGMNCIDCHTGKNHEIRGRAISVSMDLENQVYCTDCHASAPHSDQRINLHIVSVACQTCHVPEVATRQPTKIYWDWSAAGQDLPEDPHTYLKIKGAFIYEEDVIPEYYWFSGLSDRYILGDKIDPLSVVQINVLAGDIHDPAAKIMPFKVHVGKQPYDAVYSYLLQPQTAGDDGYWTTFDWDRSLRLGSQATGLPYSGSYGFAETEMYWSVAHMVAPKENALQCNSCHGPKGRFDWTKLGYPGDPITWGGRFSSKP